jgi:hypothetical protein
MDFQQRTIDQVIRAFCIALLFGPIALPAQALREINFTVYGQYPVRGVEFLPVSQAALAAGAKEAAPVTIVTHSLARMGPYAFKGGNQILFHDAASKKEVAQITLALGCDKWLLIFVRNPRYKIDPAANLQYLIYPFDDSRRNLPKNSLVFINISGKELDGLLEDKNVRLRFGESGSYRVQQSLPINLWAQGFEGKKLLPALIKTYRFKPDHRYLMIFFPPVLRGSMDLDVRFLSQAVEPRKSSQNAEDRDQN